MSNNSIYLIKIDSLVKASAFCAGFLSIFTAFYFKLGPLNMRVNDIPFFIAFGIVAIKLLKSGFTLYKIGLSSFVFVTFIVLYYLINLLHLSEFNSVFEIGAIKYFLNRIPWILIYALILAIDGRNFIKSFIKGFVWGNLFNAILMILEGSLFFASGTTIDYSFLQILGIQTQEEKNITNQGFVRPTGVTVDTNYAAAYGIFAILLIEYLQSKSAEKKQRYNFAKLFLLIPCFLVQSRTAIFALMLTFIVSVLLRMTNKSRKVIIPYLSLMLITSIAVIGIYLYQNIPDLYTSIYTRLFLSDSSSGVRRIYINEILSHYAKDGLVTATNIFGHGTGSSGYFLGNTTYGKTTYWAPESNYIAWFIEQGPFFILFYMAISCLTFLRLLKANNTFALCFVYLNLIGISYNFLGDRVFWIMLIIFMVIPNINKSYLKTPVAV